MRMLNLALALQLAAFGSASHFGIPNHGPDITLPSSSFGPPANATFDYLIVGGGTAGLTVATRLTQGNPSLRVAVVEAGGFYEVGNGNRSIVPGYAALYTGSDPKDTNPHVDWGFQTTPQPGAANRRIHYPRGKTLGGTSARNYMAYHRPSAGAMQR